MYRECPADLSMVRVILGDCYYDEHIHSCQVIRYIPDRECIYLLSDTAELSVFSLDALYECEIINENEDIEDAVNKMVELANKKGGNDNITAIMFNN